MNVYEEALVNGLVSGMEKVAKSKGKDKKGGKSGKGSKGWLGRRWSEVKGAAKKGVKEVKGTASQAGKIFTGKGVKGARRRAAGIGLGAAGLGLGAAGGAGLMAALRKRKEKTEE